MVELPGADAVFLQLGLEVGGGDFLGVVDDFTDFEGAFAEAEALEKAGEKFAIGETDDELGPPGEKLAVDGVDKGDAFGVVLERQGAAGDDVGVALVEFAEAAFAGFFAAVDFVNLGDFEREGEFALVACDKEGEWDGQVEAKGELGVAFFELVDLFVGLATGFGEQGIGAINEWRVVGAETALEVSSLNQMFDAVEFGLLIGPKA